MPTNKLSVSDAGRKASADCLMFLTCRYFNICKVLTSHGPFTMLHNTLQDAHALMRPWTHATAWTRWLCSQTSEDDQTWMDAQALLHICHAFCSMLWAHSWCLASEIVSGPLVASSDIT